MGYNEEVMGFKPAWPVYLDLEITLQLCRGGKCHTCSSKSRIVREMLDCYTRRNAGRTTVHEPGRTHGPLPHCISYRLLPVSIQENQQAVDSDILAIV